MHKLTQSFAIAAILAIATLATGIPAQPLHAQAQQGQLTVTGVVTDAEGVPLPGATIRIENTTTGTITDAQGRYSLKVRKGQVVNVKMNDLQSGSVLSIDNALQGRIAGADIMSTDGAPGATTTIRIRGSRSITASNEPLYVVDGIIDAIHDLNDINSDDIANISVLKDASSTAIYGSRGANGVIIVTTKQGSGKKSPSSRADWTS